MSEPHTVSGAMEDTWTREQLEAWLRESDKLNQVWCIVMLELEVPCKSAVPPWAFKLASAMWCEGNAAAFRYGAPIHINRTRRVHIGEALRWSLMQEDHHLAANHLMGLYRLGGLERVLGVVRQDQPQPPEQGLQPG